jgi:hypothetical protein
MRVLAYLYNAERGPGHVQQVLDRLDERTARDGTADRAGESDAVDRIDVSAGADARREAMLTLRESVRIGDNPDAIYDEDGTPAFVPGVLITADDRGRRSVHVGREALAALDGGAGES